MVAISIASDDIPILTRGVSLTGSRRYGIQTGITALIPNVLSSCAIRFAAVYEARDVFAVGGVGSVMPIGVAHLW